MQRFRTAAFVAVAALLGASACAPTIARQGFQVMDAAPRDVKVGEDNKSSVLGKLGSPSAVSTFEPNVWFYVSQTTEKYTYHMQQVTARDVTVVTFDPSTELVASVENLDLADARVRLLATVWDSQSWGSFSEFQRWIRNGEPDPPPAAIAAGVRAFRGR